MEGEGYLVWTKETVVTISWKSNKKDGTVRDAGPKGDLMGLIVRVGKSRDFLWICYDFVSRHLPPPSGSGLVLWALTMMSVRLRLGTDGGHIVTPRTTGTVGRDSCLSSQWTRESLEARNLVVLEGIEGRKLATRPRDSTTRLSHVCAC